MSDRVQLASTARFGACRIAASRRSVRALFIYHLAPVLLTTTHPPSHLHLSPITTTNFLKLHIPRASVQSFSIVKDIASVPTYKPHYQRILFTYISKWLVKHAPRPATASPVSSLPLSLQPLPRSAPPSQRLRQTLLQSALPRPAPPPREASQLV